jgi:hypothetical protein
MTVVLDTNIVASATFWRGKPAHCLEAWLLGKYELAISQKGVNRRFELELRAWFCGGCGQSKYGEGWQWAWGQNPVMKQIGA